MASNSLLMTSKRAKLSGKAVTLFSYVGNLGCIRFPEKIRKASGIKRDDTLVVTVESDATVILEKLDIPKSALKEEIFGIKKVTECLCPDPPEACSKIEPTLVKVGWSYVELDEALATRLGFLPGAPIKLFSEESKIAVSLHKNRRGLKGVERPACPP